MSGPTGNDTPIPAALWHPTDTNLFDAQNGPMANLGTGLVGIYQAYVQSAGQTSQLAAEFPNIEFSGGMVGIQVKSLGGDFSTFQSDLTNVGVKVLDSSAYYGLVDGWAPVNELPTIASLPQTMAGQANYKPFVSAAPTEFQGEAYNQAETSMFADVARTEFNVDGTGVTVGVLSDSVSVFGGGLADSYKTGDLNSAAPVDVLQDGPAGSTDEGRAMLENIHDVAPGASLAFATGVVGGDLGFGTNIVALANTAHANIINDDLTYADEPFFQDGLIAQGVNTVVSQGVTYFSSAGNEANDGYLSTFRAANTSITGIGSGTFQNFNPNGGTNVELPLTTDGKNAQLTFEFDQPFATQEPAGSPNVVTSNVDIYIIDAATGNIVVGANANNNNVAMQEPLQIITIPNAGSYFVAIQVISGPNPGHVEFFNLNENVDAVPSEQYAAAGGTYYPSSVGHHTGVNNIGVGATPWWAPAPYLGQNPLANEPFSSQGPGIYVFSPNGTALASGPIVSQNPSITAPDGGNTSFFSPGQIIDTSNPPFPGEPATATNLSQDLPTFFGTSSATPNAAAVAALMLQKVPQLTPAQIRTALEDSAVPMNGQAPGTWNAQSGFGLVNAVAAINAADLLRVASTSPANGSVVTVTPSAITVTFNKPVNFSTISAGDLTFTSAPLGVTVDVGTPIAVDNPTDPTIVQFPFSFTRPVGELANGSYTFSVQSLANAPVISEDGKDLVASGKTTFTLADTTAPDVVATKASGRTVQIQFSKALDPATVTLANIFVIRQGGATVWPPSATNLSSYIDLNSDPRATISYAIGTNPSTGAPTYTVTLNYDNLPQTEMPTDNYAIVVLSQNGTNAGVTDIVGNSLDGNFTGAFPSGANGLAQNFVQNLGMEVLQAPIITTFVMTPTATNDTGIVGDQNTNISQPTFIGQVFAPFPATVANLSVYIEFDGIHDGVITLAVGDGGRGFTGTVDEQVTTDANGTFTVSSAALSPKLLPEGFQHVQAVVVGQIDSPPLPGLSSSLEDAFRIDKTSPQITAASTPTNPSLPLANSPSPGNITALSSLTSLTLVVQDPVTQTLPIFATPAQVLFAALNPVTAANISNYSLINTSNHNANESQFISTATFVAMNPLLDPTNTFVVDYKGEINLTFLPGLPAGIYEFVAHTTELQFPGITDSAGNPLDDTNVPNEGAKDFQINFDIQPQAVYITSMALEKGYTSNGSSAIGDEQSYFEIPPAGGANTRDNVAAPPTAVVIDFSNPLPFGNYSNDVQLIQSADGATSPSDGDFGNLGEGGMGSSGTGFTTLSDYTVTLYNYNPVTQASTAVVAGGTGNRLVLQLNPGDTLSADDYRVYIPNQLGPNGTPGTAITDIYGNQLDGENLGDQTAAASPDFPSLPNYEDLQSSGVSRQDDMSGDGVAGGAFMAGFTVVNYGNVVYARPDYVENPLVPSTLSNGSLANPYPVLAPEGNPLTAPNNQNHNPNGGLNSTFFYQPGNFNQSFDFSGDGVYEQSALYAASQLTFPENASPLGVPQLGGPVVVVALPGIPQRNPLTGLVSQASFVLQAPAGNNSGVTNGSTSVPFNTTLVFNAGATLKSQNAALFVENQGSALQALGTATDPVTFTSYNDASIGGATNNNPDTSPFAGDWGGIVFRNYDDQSQTAQQTQFPVEPTGNLVGLNGGAAASGASDVMSILNNADVRYAGGAVPQGSSNFFSAITLFNSRPAITNSNISLSGGTGGTEAAIGADMDSFREDDSARGPLIRQVNVSQDSLNGIWLMAESNGFIEPTTAMSYPNNSLGGTNGEGGLVYTFFEPLPFIVLAQLIVGQEFEDNSGGQTSFVTNRLYIQPGSLVAFNRGSALDVLNPESSLNVGSRAYITAFDQPSGYAPVLGSTSNIDESAADPQVLFTTIYDDTSTATTTLVPTPINITGEATTPTLTSGMWGGVGIQSGAIAVINAATFRFGGGAINTPDFTIPSQSVLSFITNDTTFTVPFEDLGSKVYITNNNFFDNFDAAMQIEPNGLLAGNPLTPLVSGHPFFRGNVMQGNGIDGLAVVTDRVYLLNAATNFNYVGPVEGIPGPGSVNQTVSTVWDSTDLTYVLRGTIVLAGAYGFGGFGGGAGNLAPPIPGPTYGAIPNPTVSLTIQAALPGTLLADGETIPSPGQSVIVKMLNDEAPNGLGAANLATTFGSTGTGASENTGAGFSVGVEDGVDPPASPLVDPGAYSELRILGIPGNQTTGQQRVPVIMTSLRDDTVGTTVRGVTMDDIFNSFPTVAISDNGAYAGQSLTTPLAGDGGYIYIGGISLTEYDPTNPLEGSIISNADISYMSRIEVQGGGIIDTGATAGNWQTEKTGYSGPASQFNSAMMFTISDSQLNQFSDAAVFVHPEALTALIRTAGGFPTRGTLDGEPVDLYLYNDTISNSGQGVHINSETGDDPSGDTGYQAVILNNTFYNDPFAIQTIAPQHDATPNEEAAVSVLAMNNIFDGSSTIAVDLLGQAALGQEQYNLYFGNATNLNITTNDGDWLGNSGAVFADPQFVDAAAGNFELQSTSPAIDQARSEIGPLAAANILTPTVTTTVSNGLVTEIRTNPATLPFPQQPGRNGTDGGFSFVNDPSQIVTLPGSTAFSFSDQWQPTLTTDPSGDALANPIPGTYDYAPYLGQRDLLGFIRAPKTGAPGVGFGSNPFIDIGAYQYVNLHPPQVTGVTETPSLGATPVNFYTVGTSPAGANATPWTINITFNGPIDPNSITANTVQLVDLGSNPAAPVENDINLAGKLSYDSSTDTVIINLGAAGLTLSTDAYQITLFGSGSPVLTNPQGIALDGENTAGDTSTGAQLALPSGNGYPGGNFFDSFIIDTTPPSVLAGSLKLDPASDTNIVGDNITSSAAPTFDGTVSEPNAQLVPVAGQTAIVDIGIAVVTNGVLTTYFDPTLLPAADKSLAQYIRANAGSGISSTGGAFQVTVGVDGANTGLVTNTTPLPTLQGVYNVGPDGLLSPLPGDDSGFYVARVRVIDQSGNQSSTTDPNAQAPFVVDNTPPTITFAAPTANQIITNLGSSNEITFTLTTSENIDQTHFTAASLQVINAGPDGILGDADDVTVPINPSSIKFTLLDKGTGGQGREQISFTTQGTLTNNLYQVTLLNSGANAVRDIAGNSPTSGASEQFAVDVPSLAANFFVGGPSFVTNSSSPLGSRENPYPTISAAMKAANAGDVVAVLPGVYTELVTMKQFVRLLSVDPSSTDNTVFASSTGDAHQTVIRAPFVAAGLSDYNTVTATGLESFTGLATEIAGFTIASPLVGDPAIGTINPSSAAIAVTNSNILIDKDYIIDAGIGISVTASGSSALSPVIENDGVIGNLNGVEINDGGGTTASFVPATITNNDFAFNTIGLNLGNTTASPIQANVDNNIFWQNHDQTLARAGFAIFSANPGKVNLRNNLFQSNGASDGSQANATNNLGNGFNPALLGTTAQAAVNDQGNFVGNASFVFPIDPRPGSDGPATFFLDSDFQITADSAAIDNALESTAVPTDLLGNTQVKISGAGFGLPGYGPRDVGAFEFNGTGGVPIGGNFRVVSTSLVPVAGQTAANGATVDLGSAPTSVIVTFSGKVNPASINATDLVLSGTALNSAAPAHATSLTWIDADTVEFNLVGQFNTTGSLSVSLAAGTVQSTQGAAVAGYSDHAVLDIGVISPPVSPPSNPNTGQGGSLGTGTGTGTATGGGTGTTTPAPAPTPSPTPAPAPHGPLHPKKGHAVVHPKKHPVKHVIAPKPKHVAPKPKHVAPKPKHVVVVTHKQVKPKHPKKG